MMYLVRNARGEYLQRLHHPSEVEDIDLIRPVVGWCWGPFKKGEEQVVPSLHSKEEVTFMTKHPELWVGKDKTAPLTIIPVSIRPDRSRKFFNPIPFDVSVQNQGPK